MAAHAKGASPTSGFKNTFFLETLKTLLKTLITHLQVCGAGVHQARKHGHIHWML
jgi:hypothetical protein